jgi:uncharacterized protein (DUF302 family)
MSYHFSRTLEAPFAAAVERIKQSLAARGFGVLSEIDVAATMKAKLGEHLPAYVILGACSPRHAFRALQAEPLIGTMLPCNVIVRETADGEAQIAAVDPVASMQAIDNPALDGVAAEVRALLQEALAQA